MSQKEQLVIMDVCAIPEGWNGQAWLSLIKEEKVVLYDSTRGSTPIVVNVEKGKGLKLVNASTEKGKELINKYK